MASFPPAPSATSTYLGHEPHNRISVPLVDQPDVLHAYHSAHHNYQPSYPPNYQPSYPPNYQPSQQPDAYYAQAWSSFPLNQPYDPVLGQPTTYGGKVQWETCNQEPQRLTFHNYKEPVYQPQGLPSYMATTSNPFMEREVMEHWDLPIIDEHKDQVSRYAFGFYVDDADQVKHHQTDPRFAHDLGGQVLADMYRGAPYKSPFGAIKPM